MTTPEALRELRRVSGLTQSESATACLATLEEWRDWESGRAPMHPAIYRALIEAISRRKKGYLHFPVETAKPSHMCS